MKTHSFGKTPKSAIRKALQVQCPDGYPMQLVGRDREALTRVVNQGIDSHLEAVTGITFKQLDRKLGKAAIARYLDCNISEDNMMVILRRLYEDEGDDAWSLRSGILSTLDIEEV
jgi:hypothetical protein